ncbi:MAG TPA: SRPBCC family protein [Gemmatimonadales bacterium]|nr:SRPBCC family protein [Gemmatimonadales bacterium]
MHLSGSRDDGVNVGTTERILSGVAGTALLIYSLRRHRARRLLLPVSGSLILRGITGRCAVNRAIGRDSARREPAASPVAGVARGEGIKVERSIVIERPAEELYAFWRDLENLPRFMEHLESVTVLNARRSRWTARAPAGTWVTWEAEIHNEVPGELIAWRSLPGAEVNNAGSVHFTPAPDGRGTVVRVVLSYAPPAGRLGAAVAKLLGEAPEQQVSEDLRRFKQVTEAQDIPAAGSGHPLA